MAARAQYPIEDTNGYRVGVRGHARADPMVSPLPDGGDGMSRSKVERRKVRRFGKLVALAVALSAAMSATHGSIAIVTVHVHISYRP